MPDAVLELLVRTFRDLRANGEKKTSMDTLTAIMSTAEAVNVAHAVGVRAWFLANRAGEPADLVDCIAGTIVKDNEEDRAGLAALKRVSPRIKKLTGRLLYAAAACIRGEIASASR